MLADMCYVQFNLHPSYTPRKSALRRPAESRNRPLTLHLNAIRVVARAILRVRINSHTVHDIAVIAQRTVDRQVLVLARHCSNEVDSTLIGPAVDEVSVAAERVAGSEHDGRGAGPARREDLAEIVADGEAESRHSLHARWALVIGAWTAGFVG